MAYSTPKNDVLKRIKTYSTFATAILAAGSAKATVTYTDVNPDDTLTNGEVFNLDLNGDNTTDFTLKVYSGVSYISGIPMDFNAVLLSAGATNEVNYSAIYQNNYFGPVPNNKSVKIDGNLDWGNVDPKYFYFGLKLSYIGIPILNIGNFAGKGDKYVALKMVDGSNYTYGWVRVNVAGNLKSLIVKDYAYNDQAGNAIASGDTVDLGGGASVKEINNLKNVSAYSFQNKININFLNGKISEGTATISNSLGQEVFSQTLSDAQTQISIDEPMGNFYILSIITKEGVLTKKLFLKN